MTTLNGRIKLEFTSTRWCVHHRSARMAPSFSTQNSGVENMLLLAHAVTAEGKLDPNPKAQEQASQFLQDILFETELNATTRTITFVADAAASAVISACHRNPYYEVSGWRPGDDDLLPDSLDLSYCCSAAMAWTKTGRPPKM